jgi:hypothetical protein
MVQTMKNDAISTPGLLPNAQRLRQEVIKSIGHCEVQRMLVPAVVPSGAVSLRAFLVEAIAYLDENTGTEAPE